MGQLPEGSENIFVWQNFQLLSEATPEAEISTGGLGAGTALELIECILIQADLTPGWLRPCSPVSPHCVNYLE